jgi:hypothetical protein
MAPVRDDDHFRCFVTVSRVRPRARRRFNTFLPSAVDIRYRKPCLRIRRRFFGCQGRFISCPHFVDQRNRQLYQSVHA